MKFFKKLFSKKEKPVESKQEFSEPVVTGKEKKCQSCGGYIFETQRYTKQRGLYFHRQCWKREKKAVLG